MRTGTDTLETPGGGRYRWTILAVGVGAQGALSALQQGLPALGPVLRDELELSLAQVGVVLTSVSWGIMLTLLLWGWLADRIGERMVIAAGLGGAALTLPLLAAGGGLRAALLGLAVAAAVAAIASAVWIREPPGRSAGTAAPPLQRVPTRDARGWRPAAAPT